MALRGVGACRRLTCAPIAKQIKGRGERGREGREGAGEGGGRGREPPAALVGRVDPEDVQLLLAAVLLGVQAEEVLPVLVQVVDQVAVEAVLGDDVDGACREIRSGGSASVCRLILSAAAG